MYYLQSRYYDPTTCRFINADDPSMLGANGDFASLNLFLYCGNNPIAREDAGGYFWLSAIVGAVVNVVTTYIAAKVTNQEYTWKDAAVAATSGFVNAIPGFGPLASGFITGTYTGVTAYQNGASVGESIGCGVFAGMCTTASIGNLSNATDPALDIATSATVDLVFGTGYNTMSAGVYRATITEPSNSSRSFSLPQTAPQATSYGSTGYHGPSSMTNRLLCEIILR